ncbi:MAG: CDC27 family protein [Bacteroidota bacterium]
MRSRYLCITLFLWATLPLAAQTNLSALYSQGKYEECMALGMEQLSKNAQDSMALFFQGLCYIQQEKYETAYLHLKDAEQTGFPQTNICLAQQALCLTQLGETTTALNTLGKLVEAGFGNYTIISQDEFAPLHENPRFQAYQDSIHRRAFPCYYDPNYTHFDFWVGEWEVFAGETKAGENIITKQEGGCAVLEQYTTARDYVGQSYNYYDPADRLWKQIWIDHTRGISNYVESERKPGYLQFISTDKSHPAGYANLRMTFTLNDDGSVRQHMEQQDAEGKWQTVFDGRYVRKASSQ